MKRSNPTRALAGRMRAGTSRTLLAWTGATAIGLALLASVSFESLLAQDTAEPAKRSRVRYLKARKMRPRHGRKFVDTATEVSVRFNRAIDPASVGLQTVSFTTIDGYDVEWTFRLEKNGKKLILTPSQILEPGTDYRFEVRPGLVTEDGRTLKRKKTAFFFTDPVALPFIYLRQEQLQTVSARLSIGRAFHSAAVMEDGTVLISGGQSSFDPDSGIATLTDSSDVLEPLFKRFQALNSVMQNPRAFHPSAAIPGGALVLGGWDGNDATDTTDRFDLTLYRLFPGPRMLEKRDFHAAVQLADGRVLVTGGLNYDGGVTWSETAEIYDPQTGAFRHTFGAPVRRRAGHLLTPLPDGRVLVSGGEIAGGAFGTIEFFDPVTETFRAGRFAAAAGRQNHNVTTLNEDGVQLLSDGGSSNVEYFDPVTERFSFAGNGSVPKRSQSTASLLPEGRVLIAGGLDSTANDTLALRSLDLFVPGLGDFGRVISLQAQLAFPRAGHTAHTLPNGDILFVGGVGTEDPASLSSAELLVVDKPEDDG